MQAKNTKLASLVICPDSLTDLRYGRVDKEASGVIGENSYNAARSELEIDVTYQ